MIKAIEVYLITENKGLEAVELYKDGLDAQVLSLTTFGQAIPDTPEEHKDLLLNAQLDLGGIRLQLSDNNPVYDYVLGTNMTACLQLDQVEHTQAIYEKLAVNAKKIDLPLQETPWSPAYAILTDQFGMNWQLNTDIPGFVSDAVQF